MRERFNNVIDSWGIAGLYIAFVAGIGFSLFIYSLPDFTTNHLKEWSTLYAGALAIGAAIIGGLFVRNSAHKQIEADDLRHRRTGCYFQVLSTRTQAFQLRTAINKDSTAAQFERSYKNLLLEDEDRKPLALYIGFSAFRAALIINLVVQNAHLSISEKETKDTIKIKDFMPEWTLSFLHIYTLWASDFLQDREARKPIDFPKDVADKYWNELMAAYPEFLDKKR